MTRPRTSLRRLAPVAALLLLALAAAPAHGHAYAACEPLPSGYRACGQVTAAPGSLSTAEGEATGVVTWEHCLHLKNPWFPPSCNTQTSLAYAGTVTGPYATTTCVKGVLKADGVLIAETLWIC